MENKEPNIKELIKRLRIEFKRDVEGQFNIFKSAFYKHREDRKNEKARAEFLTDEIEYCEGVLFKNHSMEGKSSDVLETNVFVIETVRKFSIKELLKKEFYNDAYMRENHFVAKAIERYYDYLCNEHKKTTSQAPAPTNNLPKLVWNGQKNTLVDVFRQLKAMTGKNNKPLLEASNEELAEFLKNNFNVFEKTSVKTIPQLFTNKTKRPKKGNHKINLKWGNSDIE